LKVRFGDQISWELRTGGLYATTEPDFDQPLTTRTDPEQAAQAWQELSREIRMPMNPAIWYGERPGSPNAACYAIKAAQLQGARYGEAITRLLREGTFLEALNLGRRDRLLAAARRVPGLDVERFARDLSSAAVRAAFRRDWQAARNPVAGAPDTKKDNGRLRYAYPTFEFYRPEASRPERVLAYLEPAVYSRYVAALRALAPQIEQRPAPTPEKLFGWFSTVTTLEAAVCCDLTLEEAHAALDELAARGLVRCTAYGPDLWAKLWHRTA